VKRKGGVVRRRLKEAWSKHASRRTEIGYEAQAPDELATDSEVQFHQGRKA